MDFAVRTIRFCHRNHHHHKNQGSYAVAKDVKLKLEREDFA
jgi:hypothetical protein